MTAQDINESLYRPILQGTEFDYLMPKPTFKTVKLANGNTKVAINEMAKWAKQYAHETKEVASALIGNTLTETLDNIQWFLYWHINYSIDGTDQNLKSPAYAWATKQEGTDCKSYTIFASTILLNLGIKHYLRRIKQEVDSDAFTHVYAVIPKNQTTGKLPKTAQFNKDYYIIDATIEINNELPFTEKDDIYMEPVLPIYGMAAAMGCANYGCSHQIGLNAPDNQVLQEYYEYFDFLESQGIPQELIDQAHKLLNYYISNDILPTIDELFDIQLISAYGLGAGITPFTTTGPMSSLPSVLNIGGGGSSVPNATTGLIQTGITAGANAILPGSGFLIPPDLAINVGNVLKYGLNSWGASQNPGTQEKIFKDEVVPYVQQIVSGINLNNVQESINEIEKYLMFIIKIQEHKLRDHTNANSTKAARKLAIQMATDLLSQTIDPLLNQLKQNGVKVNISQKFTTDSNHNYTYADPNSFHGDKGYYHNVYSLDFSGSNSNMVVQPNQNNTTFPTQSNAYDASGNAISSIPRNDPQQAGMSTGTMVILAGLAIGGVFLAIKKK